MIFRVTGTPYYERKETTEILGGINMFIEFVTSDYFGFVMTVAKLYDEKHSVEEIAQKLRVPNYAVNEAIMYISMARENYRIGNF